MKVKHIFLTGKIQIGKSTLLKSVLSDLVNEYQIEYDGFTTYFDNRQSDSKILYMERKTSDSTAKGMKYPMIHFVDGRPQMQTLQYETSGMELLEEINTNTLLIFDECGKFERNSVGYVNKVNQILDGNTHVFGVLRKDPSIEWLAQIVAREDVKVFEITEENRNFLKEEVKKLILKILGV